MKKDAAIPRRRERLGRRDLLKTAAVASVAAGVASQARPGRAAEPAAPTMLAYASDLSAAAGEEVAFHVSTNAPRYAVRVIRQGVKPEVVWEKADLAGVDLPVPQTVAMDGCEWPVAVKIPTKAEWRSGYYRVDFIATAADGKQTEFEAFFALRSAQPGRDARILLQLSTNTYQAYNNFGGSSLYSGPKFPRVSFHRPIRIYDLPKQGPGLDSQNPNTWCAHTWELPFLEWCEWAGYVVDVCTNADLEFRPEILKPYQLVLSVGHDEYWSSPMRDHLEKYIEDGGHAAFFSGNTCCWQVRFENEGRTMWSYKWAYQQDPVFQTDDRRFLTSLWSHPLVGRPENRMTGVGFPYGGYNGFFGEFIAGPGSGAYTVHRPDHWLFAGTNLKAGDEFGAGEGIVGYECDGCEFEWVGGLPVPTQRDGTPENFEIAATGPATWSPRDGSIGWAQEVRRLIHAGESADKVEEFATRMGAACLGVYERGGTVFTCGSTDWSFGLAGGDKVVERVTRNIFDRLAGVK